MIVRWTLVVKKEGNVGTLYEEGKSLDNSLRISDEIIEKSGHIMIEMNDQIGLLEVIM